MKVGLQVNSFTWPGGTEAIGPTLARICLDADEAGFDSIWVMDHFFQIRGVGRPEEPMLEGWTTLTALAQATRRIDASGRIEQVAVPRGVLGMSGGGMRGGQGGPGGRGGPPRGAPPGR